MSVDSLTAVVTVDRSFILVSESTQTERHESFRKLWASVQGSTLGHPYLAEL